MSFTITQLQRLRELSAAPAVLDALFQDPASRDARFKALERKLTAEGRERLAQLRRSRRSPMLCELSATLREQLTAAGLLEVATPHIVSREALRKMGIKSDDSLSDQIFWLDRSRCLRPMLAPNLYTLLRRLGRLYSRPFAIFEIGTCFRRDSQGSRHLNEFTMLNLVELGTPLAERRQRLEALADAVMHTSHVAHYEWRIEQSTIYGDTLDLLADGLEVCSAAMGPHALDDAWGITEPWVGLGFGLERLLLAREGLTGIERVARSLSYLDGVRLNL